MKIEIPYFPGVYDGPLCDMIETERAQDPNAKFDYWRARFAVAEGWAECFANALEIEPPDFVEVTGRDELTGYWSGVEFLEEAYAEAKADPSTFRRVYRECVPAYRFDPDHPDSCFRHPVSSWSAEDAGILLRAACEDRGIEVAVVPDWPCVYESPGAGWLS